MITKTRTNVNNEIIELRDKRKQLGDQIHTNYTRVKDLVTKRKELSTEIKQVNKDTVTLVKERKELSAKMKRLYKEKAKLPKEKRVRGSKKNGKSTVTPGSINPEPDEVFSEVNASLFI